MRRGGGGSTLKNEKHAEIITWNLFDHLSGAGGRPVYVLYVQDARVSTARPYVFA